MTSVRQAPPCQPRRRNLPFPLRVICSTCRSHPDCPLGRLRGPVEAAALGSVEHTLALFVSLVARTLARLVCVKCRTAPPLGLARHTSAQFACPARHTLAQLLRRVERRQARSATPAKRKRAQLQPPVKCKLARSATPPRSTEAVTWEGSRIQPVAQPWQNLTGLDCAGRR